jgi:hypothetical protein
MRRWSVLTSCVVVLSLLAAMGPPTARAGDEPAAVGFTPAYPAGPSYDAFTATLPGLGLLSDTNGDGKVNDERCKANGRAAVAIVDATLRILTAAGIACNALPSPGPQEVCFGVLTAPALALQADAIVFAQCALQDGLVQTAEIQASFENTRHLLASDLEEELLTCSRLLSHVFPASVGGHAEQVRDFVQVRLDQFEATGRSAATAKKARGRLDSGITALTNAQYSEAYEDFCVAYRHIAGGTP